MRRLALAEAIQARHQRAGETSSRPAFPYPPVVVAASVCPSTIIGHIPAFTPP